jgi:hypothetical protein
LVIHLTKLGHALVNATLKLISTYSTNKRIVHNVDVCEKFAVIIQGSAQNSLRVFAKIKWIQVGSFVNIPRKKKKGPGERKIR